MIRNSPQHYDKGIYEPAKIIRAHNAGFFIGNALKYIFRAPYKGTQIQDLEKAIDYLKDEIAHLKGDPSWSTPATLNTDQLEFNYEEKESN